MQDGFSILSPAGYVMDVGVVANRNGPGTYGGVVVAPRLPDGAIMARGVGEHILRPLGVQLSGRQGTMSISCIAGTAGAAQAVAFIGVAPVGSVQPTLLLGVALDSQNRPYALIIDNLGFQAGISGVVGPAIPSGTPIEILFAWDVNNLVFADDRAGFQFNNNVTVWYPDVVTWDPFVPDRLYVGTTFGGLALADFTGTVGKVQVSNAVSFPIAPGAITEEEEIFFVNTTMAGESGVTAPISLVLGGSSNMDGDSSLSITPSLTLAGVSTMVGDSSVAADLDIYDEESLTVNGDSSLSASGDLTLGGVTTMAGDSSQTAAADVDLVGASSMAGDSGFTASATVTTP